MGRWVKKNWLTFSYGRLVTLSPVHHTSTTPFCECTSYTGQTATITRATFSPLTGGETQISDGKFTFFGFQVCFRFIPLHQLFILTVNNRMMGQHSVFTEGQPLALWVAGIKLIKIK